MVRLGLPEEQDVTDTTRRIQRRRAKGWRMPPGAIYVGRPTMWGNPWPGVHALPPDLPATLFRQWLGVDGDAMPPPAQPDRRYDILRRIDELRGRDLACWCRLCLVHAAGRPLGTTCRQCDPCHADVLLELANPPLRCEAV